MTHYAEVLDSLISEPDPVGAFNDGGESVFMAAWPTWLFNSSSEHPLTHHDEWLSDATDMVSLSSVSRLTVRDKEEFLNSPDLIPPDETPIGVPEVDPIDDPVNGPGNKGSDEKPPDDDDDSSSSREDDTPATNPGDDYQDPPDTPESPAPPEDADDDEAYSPTAWNPSPTLPGLTPTYPEPTNDIRPDGPWNRPTSSLPDRGFYDYGGYGSAHVDPVSLSPILNPPEGTANQAVEDSTAGYISQRDLEDALGREAWTMCCAATFAYAVQTRHPDLERDALIEAVGSAATTSLSGSEKDCVSEDGYVGSFYQYSQAISKKLDLDEYVDVSGQYATLEAARAAGATTMKVELSGTLEDRQLEHHVLVVGDQMIDPSPGEGFTNSVDDGSVKVENVMALDWYPMP